VTRSDDQANAEHATVLYLHELLVKPGRCRRLWMEQASRRGYDVVPHQVHPEAVRVLIAQHQYDCGILKEDPGLRENEKKRPYKDVVYRVFNQKQISAKTLSIFIDALAIDEYDAGRLWDLHGGYIQSPIVVGNLPSPEDIGLPEPKHRTIHLREEHHLGPDGLPAWHETIQTIESLVDDLEYYPFRFDTNELKDISSFEVLHGGTQGQAQQIGGIYELPIVFCRPLSRRKTLSMRYKVNFRYSVRPDPSFRRTAYRRVDSVEIYVRFHPNWVPSKVWWTEWENWHTNSPIIREEPVELDDELSIHRPLIYIERAVVGFRWI
jgi:hypothetical protein